MGFLKGYRTIVFNVIMTSVMLFNLWGREVDVDAATVNQAIDTLDAAITAIWGIGNAFLRSVTDTKIGSSA